MKSHTNKEIAAIRNPLTYKEAQEEQKKHDGIAIDEPDATRFTLQENGDYLEDKIDNGPLARYYKLDPNFADEHADCKITELKEQNKASGWVDGLPPIGEVCEAYADSIDAEECRFIESNGVEAVVQWSRFNKGGYDVIPLNNWKFRPILTPKQRTIEALCAAIDPDEPDTESFNSEFHKIIGFAYDLGFLTLPGESNEH